MLLKSPVTIENSACGACRPSRAAAAPDPGAGAECGACAASCAELCSSVRTCGPGPDGRQGRPVRRGEQAALTHITRRAAADPRLHVHYTCAHVC